MLTTFRKCGLTQRLSPVHARILCDVGSLEMEMGLSPSPPIQSDAIDDYVGARRQRQKVEVLCPVS